MGQHMHRHAFLARTTQHAPHGFHEPTVVDHVRRDTVDGAGISIINDGMCDDADEIIKGDPAHPLAPIPHGSCEPQRNRTSQFGDRSSRVRADARADAAVNRRYGQQSPTVN